MQSNKCPEINSYQHLFDQGTKSLLKNMKNLIVLIICLAGSFTSVWGKVYKVSDPAAFKMAAEVVTAGDEIVITDGNYTSWEAAVSRDGKEGKPIIIRAQRPGKVVFTGEIKKPAFLLTGDFIEISGITFSECALFKAQGGNGVLIELKGTTRSRITGCTFTKNSVKAQFMPIVVVSGNGENNRVDHCTFTGNVDNQEMQIKITREAVPVYTLVDHNLFLDKEKVSWNGVNGGECIQVGQDPVMLGTLNSHAVVRDNRFIRCNGEAEVISNKSSGNSYINNYFEDCRGELVMRGGHDCLIDSNTVKGGSGGIRINGTHHTITNNKLSELTTGIRLMYGMAKGKSEIGFYVAPGDCVIKNNQITNCKTGILIGDSKNADWTGKFDTAKYPSRTMQDIAPFNITIEGNQISDTAIPIVHNEN